MAEGQRFSLRLEDGWDWYIVQSRSYKKFRVTGVYGFLIDKERHSSCWDLVYVSCTNTIWIWLRCWIEINGPTVLRDSFMILRYLEWFCFYKEKPVEGRGFSENGPNVEKWEKSHYLWLTFKNAIIFLPLPSMMNKAQFYKNISGDLPLPIIPFVPLPAFSSNDAEMGQLVLLYWCFATGNTRCEYKNLSCTF